MRPNPLVPAERYTSRDWLLCLLTLPTALEFRRVFSQLLANTVFAVMVWWGYVKFPETVGFLVAGLHPGAHLLLGGALGLLLVFRTNTAYDRFWEARRLWGFLISRVREVGCCSLSLSLSLFPLSLPPSLPRFPPPSPSPCLSCLPGCLTVCMPVCSVCLSYLFGCPNGSRTSSLAVFLSASCLCLPLSLAARRLS